MGGTGRGSGSPAALRAGRRRDTADTGGSIREAVQAMPMPRRIIIMGVSGCGKSTVGRALAGRLGLRFEDGDAYHSPDNIAKMARGVALTDADRAGWLAALADLLAAHDGIVLACSALKRSYRRTLRGTGGEPPVFIHLHGSLNVLAARLNARTGHYFTGRALLESQFAALEPPGPDEAIPVRVDDVDIDGVLNRCLAGLRDATSSR